VYSPIPLAISEKTWQKLSQADQKAVMEAARIAGKFSRDMISSNDDNQLKEMSSRGAKVNAKPDMAAFRQSVKPAYDKARRKTSARPRSKPCPRRRCSSRWPRRRCPSVCSVGPWTGP